MATPRKASAAERKRVERWVKKYRDEFYLASLDVLVIYHELPCDHDGDDSLTTKVEIDCDAAYRYHSVRLHVYPDFFEECSNKLQEEIIAHELMHLILRPLDEMIDKLRAGRFVTPLEQSDTLEHVTQWLTKIALYGGRQPSEWVAGRVKA